MRRRALFVNTIFLAGFLQGSDFVLIPALSTTLTSAPYGFSSSAFALLFLPQTVGAIVGAAAAGWVQRRLGMGRLLRLGLATNLAAMLLLVIATRGGEPFAYDLLLTESLLLGIGFGWTLSAVNHYAAHFFGKSASASITLLNAMIGGATALSPTILSELHAQLTLSAWPIVLATGFLLASLPRLPETDDDTRAAFWVPGLTPFVLAVLVYAICEGSFGSWSNLYLSIDKHLGNRAGIWALSAFWASMTLLRMLLAPLPERWISRRSLLFASSLGIASCFAVLPWLSGIDALIAAFAIAGAACSIYYPFMMSAGLAQFPEQQTQAAGLLVAALMVGEGVGSYGVGLLQRIQSLDHIFFVSALWGIPLLLGAWFTARKMTLRAAGA
jgi:fucose permease